MYAIGEIVLVVLGILIALQINNWNEWRKDRIKEVKLLNDLIENIEFNANALENIVTDFNADDESSKLIISVIKGEFAYHDSLDYHFARALNAEPLYVLSYVGYESVKNTGFDIVQNDRLKKEIINVFEMTYKIAQLRQENLPNTWSFIRSRFMSHPTAWSIKPYNFDELVEDKEFLSMVNSIKSSRWYIGQGYKDALSESQRILNLIKDELNEHE